MKNFSRVIAALFMFMATICFAIVAYKYFLSANYKASILTISAFFFSLVAAIVNIVLFIKGK